MSADKEKVELPKDLLKAIGEAFGSIASTETSALIGASIQLWSAVEKAASASLALLIAQPAQGDFPEAELRTLDNALIACGSKDYP